MAFLIERDWNLNTAPMFEFEPDWAPGGPELEDQTWFMIGWGLRIPKNRIPERAIMKTSHKSLGDVIGLDAYTWCVSDRFRSVVERIAPGQVEFIEMALQRKGGKPINDRSHYFINVLPRLDTIIWDKTTTLVVGTERDFRGNPDVETTWTRKPIIALAKAARPSGIHIWHETLHWSRFANWTFASNDLVEGLKAAGVSGLIYIPVNED